MLNNMQALVMSNSPEYASDYGNIQQCTVGVSFLGTPHHGTNAATLAAAVTRVSEHSGMRRERPGEEEGGEMPPNDGADVLRHIVDKFMMWANRSSVDLTCFFETRMTHYSSSKHTRWNDIVGQLFSNLVHMLTGGVGSYRGKCLPFGLPQSPAANQPSRTY